MSDAAIRDKAMEPLSLQLLYIVCWIDSSPDINCIIIGFNPPLFFCGFGLSDSSKLILEIILRRDLWKPKKIDAPLH